MSNSAVVGILRALLTANTAEFATAMARAADSAKVFSRDMQSVGRQASQVGTALTKTLTLPIVGLGGTVAKLAMDFESSFAGVRKTVDASEAEFAQMAQGFRDLSKTIPINVNDMNRLGEAAGALGIPKASIVDFARVMSLLGVTTNVTADQAAESIAKIQNIFGAAGKDTERFASTLVDLGNKGASTEGEILELTKRIAAAGHTVGLSEAQVLGYAAAIANVGMEAEAGGSAMSKVFAKLSVAVSEGGDKLAAFAKTAGMSAQDFAKAFRSDAAGATAQFVEGLGRIKSGGGDLIVTLNELGFKELRQADLLKRLALSGDNLTSSLHTANTAWEQNTALSEEARKRFATTWSQLTLLWNRLKDVGITIGNALLPGIKSLTAALDAGLPVLEAIGKGFASLPGPVQAVAIGLLAVVAAAGPALYIFGQLAIAAAATTAAFAAKGIATRGLSVALGFLQVQLPTVAAGISAVGNAAALSSTQVTALGLTLRGLATVAGIAGAAFAGWSLGRVIAQVFDLDTKIANLTARILGMGDVQKQLAGAAQDTINRAIERGAQATVTFAEAIKYNDEWNKKRLAALGVGTQAQQKNNDATDDGAAALERQTKAATAAKEAFDDWADTLDDFQLELPKIRGHVHDITNEISRLGPVTGLAVPATAGLSTNIKGLTTYMAMGTLHAREIGFEFDRFGKKVSALNPEVKQIGTTFKDVFAEIPDIIAQAFTGGGGMVGAIRAIGAKLGGQLGIEIGKALVTSLGSMSASIGSALGSVFVSSYLQLLITGMQHGEKAIKAATDRMLTQQDALKNANKMFIAQGLSAAEAERRTADLWRTSTTGARTGEDALRQFNAALETTQHEYEELQRLQGLQADGLDAISSAEDEYGYTAIQTSGRLLGKYEELLAAGHDQTDILHRMRDDWSKLAQDAIRNGTTLSESMRPVLQRLLDMGELVDDDGHKLTSLDDITFGDVGDAGESAMAKITLGVDTLVAAFLYSLGFAIDETQRKLLGLKPIIQDVANGINGLPGDVGRPGGGLNRNPGGGTGPRRAELIAFPSAARGHSVTPSSLIPSGLIGTPPSLMPAAAMAAGGGGWSGGGYQIIKVVLPNGQVLAETVVRNFQGAARRLGVT